MAKKYQFAVRLKEDTASRMVLGYLPSHRNLRLISLAVFGIPFILLSGSVLRNLISGTDTAWGIVAIMLLVFGLPTLSIILNPISHKIVIDEVERELIYYKNYLLGFGLNSRVNEYIYYPGEISITQKTINAFTISIILTMNNSDQVILNFLNRKEEVEQVAARIIGLITAANLTEPETDVDGEVSVRPDFTQITWNRIKSSMEVMRTEIRIWGNSLIFLGLLHVVSNI